MNSKSNELSLVAQFDDLNRMMEVLLAEDGDVNKQIKTLLENCNKQRILWVIEHNKLLEAKELIKNQAKENHSLKTTLQNVREAYKKELGTKERVQSERDLLVNKLTQVQNYLKDDDDDTVSKDSRTSLKDLVSSLNLHKLTTVMEENSSDCSLSGLEFDKTDEDNLDDNCENIMEKVDAVLANSTENEIDNEVHMDAIFENEENFDDFSILSGTNCQTPMLKNTPSTKSKASVHSKLSNLSENLIRQRQSNLPNEIKVDNKPHKFVSKNFFRQEKCCGCSAVLGGILNSAGLRCEHCRSICHVFCKTRVPVPCIPYISRENIGKKGRLILISDFVQSNCKPCVPALIVHCLKEIERRGLDLVGVYRVPASVKEVKELKDRILKAKTGIPSLKEVDVHVLCNVVKKFLGELDEALIIRISFRDFIEAVNLESDEERRLRFKEEILNLPNANRDTLAYMMLHLRKVANEPKNKVSIASLAQTFGSTILGYSIRDPPASQISKEKEKQIQVVTYLLSLDSEFWQSVTDFDTNNLDFSMMNPADLSILTHLSPVQGGRLSVGSKICGGSAGTGEMTPLRQKAKPKRKYRITKLF